jgi:hypothetical protein
LTPTWRLARILALAFGALAGNIALAESPGDGAAESDVKSATRYRTGAFVLRLNAADLVNNAAEKPSTGILAADETIEWQVYAPDSYNPAQPAGVLVYISPTQSGEIPGGWASVLDKHNVIWIGADKSGNAEPVSRRVLLAMLAPGALDTMYAIDTERVYVTGLSGGGKTASMVATDQAQLFKGAIYNCGVEVWDVDLPERIKLIRENHFVFVTGTYDQALEPTRRAYRAYKKAGVNNSKLVVVRNMTHRNPNSYVFEDALKFLDARRQPDR